MLGLGQQLQHRDVEVLADALSPDVEQHRIGDRVDRMNRVHPDAQTAGRLRNAGCDHALHYQSVDDSGIVPRGLNRLGEDVVGETVSGDGPALGYVQRAVAGGTPRLQAVRQGRNAGILRGDTNPGVARAHEEFMRPEPERFDVIAAGDVGPFDDHRTVEIALVLGTADDQPRLVKVPGADDMGGRRRNGPRTDSHRRIRRVIDVRGAGDEELLLDITTALQIEVGGEKGVVAAGAAARV